MHLQLLIEKMQNDSSNNYQPPKATGSWKFLALAIAAHGALLIVVIWNTNWAQLNLQKFPVLNTSSNLPKLVEVKKQEPVSRPIAQDSSATAPQAPALEKQTNVAGTTEVTKVSSIAQVSTNDFANGHNRSVATDNAVETRHTIEKIQVSRTQKFEPRLVKEHINKKMESPGHKKLSKETQSPVHFTPSNLKSSVKHNVMTTQIKSENLAKKINQADKESIRQENILRMQRLVSGN